MSSKVKAPDGYADVRVENDVLPDLKHPRSKWDAAFRTLAHIRDRGGEIPWSWDSIKNPKSREMIADMILDGLLVEREYVTHMMQVSGRLTLRMTDKGKNVLAIHERRKIVAGKVQAIGE